MYIKTVLIAAAVFSTVAAYDFADWLASMYAGDHNIVNIGTTGKVGSPSYPIDILSAIAILPWSMLTPTPE